MFRIFYGFSLTEISVFLILFCFLWGFTKNKFGNTKLWRIMHIALLALWLWVSLYITVFSREIGNGAVNLELFWSYKIALQGSYDYFQQIYLNVLAFFFFGLFVPELMKGKCRYIITAVCAVVISASIEFCQFRFDIGLAEIDDVFSNAVGAVIGIAVNGVSCKCVQVIGRWIKNLLRFLRRHTTE